MLSGPAGGEISYPEYPEARMHHQTTRNNNRPFEEAFCKEDLDQVLAAKSLDPEALDTDLDVQDSLYKILLKPVQTGCRNLKKIGERQYY